MALHATANDFFGLLGSEKSNEELEELAAEEWRKRWEQPVEAPVCTVSPVSLVSLSLCLNSVCTEYMRPVLLDWEYLGSASATQFRAMFSQAE